MKVLSSYQTLAIAFMVLLFFCTALCCAESASPADADNLKYLNAVLSIKKAALTAEIDQTRMNLETMSHGFPVIREAPSPGISLKTLDPSMQVESSPDIRTMIEEGQKESDQETLKNTITRLEQARSTISPVTDYQAYIKKKQELQSRLNYYTQTLIPYAEKEEQKAQKQAANAIVGVFGSGTGRDGENLNYKTLQQKYKMSDYVYEPAYSSPAIQVSPLVEAYRAATYRDGAIQGLNQFRLEASQIQHDIAIMESDERLANTIATVVNFFGGNGEETQEQPLTTEPSACPDGGVPDADTGECPDVATSQNGSLSGNYAGEPPVEGVCMDYELPNTETGMCEYIQAERLFRLLKIDLGAGIQYLWVLPDKITWGPVFDYQTNTPEDKNGLYEELSVGLYKYRANDERFTHNDESLYNMVGIYEIRVTTPHYYKDRYTGPPLNEQEIMNELSSRLQDYLDNGGI